MMFPPVQVAAPSPQQAVAVVLDDFHLAAAQADEARYFGHLDDTAVFLDDFFSREEIVRSLGAATPTMSGSNTS